MNNLLEVVKNQKIENIGEIFSYGGKMLLLGMLTVFSVLIVIWVALILFKYFFHDIANRSQNTAKNVSIPIQDTVRSADSNDDEIVAVITAAIATAEAETADLGIKFRVVSFKRK